MSGEPTGEVRPENSDASIKVRVVSQNELFRMSNRALDLVEVDIEKNVYWLETDGKTPILNKGAGPCLIMFVKNIGDGTIISGHFSGRIADHQLSQEILKTHLKKVPKEIPDEGDEILIHSQQELDNLAISDKGMYRSYLALLDRIKEFCSEAGEARIEIYLFGQNYWRLAAEPDEIGGLTENIIQRQNVVTDLERLGVKPPRIFDYRDLKRLEGTDDTLFLPEEDVILHATG